ncbi:unnamed protein product [Thelazia callipaeda]|uniref:Dipeptidyl peptidase 4 membrane form n=1 Tax=Thelazia callipaeda TaxID=103827 RepID=A0A0N5CKT6_THECL|nr:unnamed protein product [Thelazia callipaeda]
MCLLIVAAVLIITPFSFGGISKQMPLTLTDITDNTLLGSVESMEWLDSDQIVIKTIDSIKIINTSGLLMTTNYYTRNDALNRQGRVSQFSFSHDGFYIALAYNNDGFIIFLLISFCQSSACYRTFEPIGPERTGDELLQTFVWNPASNDFAFVHSNDIYYCEKPKNGQVHRITRDSHTFIYNGVADWIYQEEIFGNNVGLWWSKSGDYLAYIRIDDRKVPQIQYPLFYHQQYPTINKIPYPKTGVKELPEVTLHIWKKRTRQSREMKISIRRQSLITYLFSASWISLYGKDLLMAVFANRYQNISSITICTFDSAQCLLNYDQHYSIAGHSLWAEPEDHRIKYYSSDSYFISLPSYSASGGIFTQIARVTVPVSTHLRSYDVAAIVGYDEKKELVYFMAASPLPSQRHLYVTSTNSVSITLSRSKAVNGDNVAICVTCSIAPNCTFQDVMFSRDMDKYILSCRGPGTPRAYLSSISSNNSLTEELTDWEKLNQRYNERALATTRFENITLRSGYGRKFPSTSSCSIMIRMEKLRKVAVARVKMLLPSNFDQTILDAKYPVVVSVYAGPGSQKVTEEMTPNTLDMFLASNVKYVVVFIDGRGSGMRGWKYKEPIYGHLGSVEVDDQLEATKILAAKHHFIDSKRIAIWGWSYGGFVAAHVVERDTKQIFKCAVSIAPVTNFKLYDATYTERYMGGASEISYEHASIVKNVTMFKRVMFLLVHGIADDNVHLQNSAQLIRALGEENIQFQLMVYPDASHSLIWSRLHLFTMLIEFFEKCFRR